MRLIQEVDEPGRRNSPRGASGAVNNDMAKAVIWSFFKSNPDKVLLKVGGFIKIRVKDLKILFELLAGPEPT